MEIGFFGGNERSAPSHQVSAAAETSRELDEKVRGLFQHLQSAYTELQDSVPVVSQNKVR